MSIKITIRILPENFTDPKIKQLAAKHLSIPEREIYDISILKKSIDARQLPINYQLSLLVHTNEPKGFYVKNTKKYVNVDKKKPVNIVGSGPAGLFAALKLIEKGCKPIIYERGKNVKNRRRDLAMLTSNLEPKKTSFMRRILILEPINYLE